MAGKSDEPEVPGGRPRRPPATIDLKATEIPSEPKSDSATERSTDAMHHASDTPEPAAPEPEAAAENPAPEPPPPQADTPSAAPESRSERQGSGWSLLVAGALGAVLMVAVLAGLWAGNVISLPGAPDSSSQLSAIERQLREMAARPSPPPAPVAQPAPELAQRLTAIEQALGGLRQIEQRLARSESAAAPTAPTPDPAIQERMTRLEGATSTLTAQLSELRSRSDEAIALARESRTRAEAGVAQATSDAASETEVKALAARIGQLEQTARAMQDALTKAATAPPPADKALRAAFATAALRAAIERGDAFTTEFATVKALMPGAAALATIEPFAASGVPAPAALQKSFAAVEADIVKAAGPQTPDAGFIDKLQAKAEQLVRIRPVDSRPGDEPAAIVSRIAAQLARADVAGAIAEAEKLPQQAQRPLGAWLASAKGRQAAVQAARSLARNALAALGQGTQ